MIRFVVVEFLVLFGYLVAGGIPKDGAEEMYYWREVFYENQPIADDTLIGKYPYNLPNNNEVNGFGYHAQSGLMVVATPRFRPGVPSTLNAFCVADYDIGTSPYIWGFPDYEKNTLKASFYGRGSGRKLQSTQKYSAEYYNFFFGNKGDTARKRIPIYSTYYNYATDYNIINVYNPTVDNFCNRLYAIDSGTLYYSPNEIYYVQNPAILVFDLPSNGCQSRQFRLLRRVEIPNHLWQNPVGFIYITPDYQIKKSCDEVFLYVTNPFDNSIVVYDYNRGDFWSFTDPSMKPILSEANIYFRGGTYYLPMGILSVALGWPDKNGDRNAYYAPASSLAEYVVSTKLLKSFKRAQYKDSSNEFSLIGYRGCNHENYKQVFDDSTGVIFFGEVNSNMIRCWNTQLPFNPDTLGDVYESDGLGYFADLFIDKQNYLWFLANQLPIIFNSQDTLNVTEVNARIFRIKISDAIRGSVCDASTFYGKGK